MNTAYIELTTECNLCCNTCYNRSGEEKKNIIPADKLDLVITTLEQLFVNRIIIAGGEPLLYSGIYKLLEIIMKKPSISFLFSTNGTIHNEQFFQAYLKLAQLNVQVSLDGSCESVNSFVRGEGVFSKAAEFLTKIRCESKKPRLKMVVTQNNLHDVENFYLFSLEAGGLPEFAFVSEQGRAADVWGKIRLTTPEKVSVIQCIERKSKETGVNAFVQLCDIGCPLSDCSAPMSLYIKPNGSIYPCQMLDSDAFRLGSIFNFHADSFNQKKTEISQIAKKRESLDYNCRSCFMRSFCKHGCMAMSIIKNGEPLGNDGNCDFRRQQYLHRELKLMR